MDFFVDPSGVLFVRSCGCDEVGASGLRHGFTSFWTDHSEAWQSQHKQRASEVIAEFRERWPQDTERFDRADAVIGKVI